MGNNLLDRELNRFYTKVLETGDTASWAIAIFYYRSITIFFNQTFYLERVGE